MAKISYSTRAPRKDGKLPVFIRVTNNYTEARVATRWAIEKKEIDKRGNIRNRMVTDGINTIIAAWNKKLDELGMAADGMTANELVSYFKKERAREEVWRLDMCRYMSEEADKMEQNGNTGTASLRRCALRSFQEYMKTDLVDVNDITASMINGWVEWLLGKGARRAASLYVAQLRASFNKARREFNDDVTERIPRDPFSRIEHVRQSATNPRAITAEQMRAIMALPRREGTSKRDRYNLARDMFVLSFLLMGMNSVDLINCPPIKDGRITYERTKTRTRRDDHALISLAVPPEAEEIIKRYKGKRPGYEFEFVSRYASRHEFSAALNKGLKEVGKAVGIDGLQFYSARHTWATIAVNDVDIDKYTVHQALNHVDAKTAITDVYVKKEWGHIDRANRQVIDFVCSPPKETEQGK